jgi:hypothetical protein
MSRMSVWLNAAIEGPHNLSHRGALITMEFRMQVNSNFILIGYGISYAGSFGE